MTFGTSAYAVEYDPPAASNAAPNVCIAEEPEPGYEANEADNPRSAAETWHDDELRHREYRQLFSRLRRG